MMAALDPFVRRGLSVHVPKYFFPRALNLVSMLAGATTAVCGCGDARVDVASARLVRMRVDFMAKWMYEQMSAVNNSQPRKKRM